MTKQELSKNIATVKDFPHKGIVFKDITTLLKEPKLFKATIDMLEDEIKDIEFDSIVGTESRGFIMGCPLAINMSKGFIPARKPGKLPRKHISESYGLEYGSSTLELHTEDIKPGQKIVIVDDLLATGGTLEATINLIEKLGGVVVGIVVLINLIGLSGNSKVNKYNLKWVLEY